MAFIKEESEDVKIDETFRVKQEETETQTDLMALKEESQDLNEKHMDFVTEETSFSCSETENTSSENRAQDTGTRNQLHSHINQPFSEDSQRDSEMAGVVHRHHHFARRGYRQRVYVEHTKPLEQYTTEELYVRFRFGKADIEYLVNLLRPKLQHRTQRSHGLSVEDQILIALRFYACGTFYQVVGDYMGVVKSAVCDVVRDVSIALASLVNEFVSFPKDNQIAQAKFSFFLLGNMPNTIGAIDCTHVHIQAPRENEWEFINRKGRHSINVQLVCDADLIITNCVVKWPGSVHDARILRESALYRDLQTNRPDGIILGDSAYPLLPWLMTPFLTANTPAQARFNTAHCKKMCN
ncbi:unnamed protein product [Leuciscus chuanchicus]